MANVKISALGAGTNPASGDVFPGVQGGVTLKFDYDELEDSILTAVDARVIAASKYTAAPATNSTITFSDTSDLTIGDVLLIVHNAVNKYYVVTAIGGGTITVSGPTLAGFSITTLSRLVSPSSVQVDLFMPGNYLVGGATTDLLDRETRTLFRWQRPAAKLVYAAMRHATADTDASNQPTLNVTIGASSVFVTDFTMPNATTWVTPTLTNGAVTLGNYDIDFGDAMEIDLVTSPGNGDARDLIVSLTFVLV